MMSKYHNVENVRIEGDIIHLTVDGRSYTGKLSEHSDLLTSADDQPRNHFIISPSGYGIHWPDLDEDLAIDALIGSKHQYKHPSSTRVA
jgi:hypothetical protein